ncbi:MAG: RNA polymerase sigma factor [Candidatus Omnitrophota bacterium]
MLIYKEEAIKEFVERFLAGDKEAFNAMGRLIASDIVNISYRYVANYDDAKDVCQEVLVKLYKKLGMFRQASKISTWIYRLTINTAIDFLRRGKRIFSLREETLEDTESVNKMGEEIEKNDDRSLIKEALAKLPLRQKNAIILRHFEGLKIRQISKVLGCSQSSVKTHLTRGLEHLRQEIGGKP